MSGTSTNKVAPASNPCNTLQKINRVSVCSKREWHEVADPPVSLFYRRFHGISLGQISSKQSIAIIWLYDRYRNFRKPSSNFNSKLPLQPTSKYEEESFAVFYRQNNLLGSSSKDDVESNIEASAWPSSFSDSPPSKIIVPFRSGMLV